MAIGILAPLELETVSARATPAVVIDPFATPLDGCHIQSDCSHELVIDHLAWSTGL